MKTIILTLSLKEELGHLDFIKGKRVGDEIKLSDEHIRELSTELARLKNRSSDSEFLFCRLDNTRSMDPDMVQSLFPDMTEQDAQKALTASDNKIVANHQNKTFVEFLFNAAGETNLKNLLKELTRIVPDLDKITPTTPESRKALEEVAKKIKLVKEKLGEDKLKEILSGKDDNILKRFMDFICHLVNKTIRGFSFGYLGCTFSSKEAKACVRNSFDTGRFVDLVKGSQTPARTPAQTITIPLGGRF